MSSFVDSISNSMSVSYNSEYEFVSEIISFINARAWGFQVMDHPNLTILAHSKNICIEHFPVYFLYSWLPAKEAVIMEDPYKHENFLSLWHPTTLRVVEKSVLPFLLIFFTLCTFQFSPKLPSQMKSLCLQINSSNLLLFVTIFIWALRILLSFHKSHILHS